MKCTGLIIGLALLGLPHTAWAKWYLLASTQPNNLVVVDTETDTVAKDIALEGRGPAMNIATNPVRPQYAYVVNDLAQSVALVDLDEGKQVSSFPLTNDDELVRTMAIDVNVQGTRLFIHEMPVKKGVGSYEAQENRIRVIDLDTNKTIRTIPAPRQVMALASSQDGKRLYAFSVGQDISVLDIEQGKQIDTIPLLNRNITGIARTDGLPAFNLYQEYDHVLSFGTVTTDAFSGKMTLGIASLDLKQEDPELRITELQPFTAEHYVLTGALGPQDGKAYFSYNNLWRVDLQTRKIEKSVPLPNTYFAPFMHPEGQKLYCGSNWSDVAVFDSETLELRKKIPLGHPQSGGGNGLRFVQR
ncbi:MAG: YncE family protein [Candidatus Binatia bacterium]